MTNYGLDRPSRFFWRLLYRAHTRLVRVLSARRRIHGIEVFLFALEGRTDLAFEKITAALGLISEHDPIRYRRFVSGFGSIIVNEAGGALGSTHVESRTCKLDKKYVISDQTTVEALAVLLVHEGTHAHIESRGVSYRTARRVRIEGVCSSAEIAFLRRLPVWHSALARSTWRKRNLSQDVFDYRGDIDRRIAALVEMEAPEWLVEWTRRRGEKLLADQQAREGVEAEPAYRAAAL